MPDEKNKLRAAETYLVGKRDFRSFYVTICRNGENPERREGFPSAEQARAWIKSRVQEASAATYASADSIR